MVQSNQLLNDQMGSVREFENEYNCCSVECFVVICAEVSVVVLPQMRLPEEAESQLQSANHVAGCRASSDWLGTAGPEGESWSHHAA